jgi:type IV pilus assembly protein PilB
MSTTPNNSNPQKPAQASRPAGTPAANPAAKPAVANPAAKPAAASPSKPAAEAKPAAAAEKKPAASKPVKKVASSRDSDSGGRRKIGQIMVDLGFIDEAQLMDLLEDARANGIRFGEAALERGLINEDQLIQALAEQHGMRVANLEEAKPQANAIALIPQVQAELAQLVPLRFEDDVLTVAVANPDSLPALDDLRNFMGIRTINAELASPQAVREAIARFYSNKADESITSIIKELEMDTNLAARSGRETSIDLGSLEELQQSAPVRKLINMILLMGIKDHASDIHFEPFEEEYKIRMRCDGVLYEMVPPPRHLAAAISSRIKVMANLDIAERRLPQDGRIELNIGGNPVDLRVSVLPTMFGESVVIRVLDRTVVSLDLDRIGMEPDMLANFRRLIHKPNGIMLVTGPTGAGKTTTLYSALNELNDVSEKIITTEDPVEYEIEGIIQVPINHEIDLTFASALRAILRQDPDKILVGEIRDLETAQIAVQAALTGHMVFSTLHTNDAPSTITRLRDMGVEPYLLTATIEGILAQRLVRKICTKCRVQFDPSPAQLMELGLRPEDAKSMKFFYGEGCDHCNNLGFRGRSGLYELIEMDDDLRDMISKGASTDQLRQFCRSRNFTSLRDSGLRALTAGITTIDEVVRETVLEDEG